MIIKIKKGNKMYGQFHNEQSLRTTRTKTAAANNLAKGNRVKAASFISLFLIILTVSSTSFAGPSTPRLPKGNGNAQGR
jgi:uncharacterized protein (DUF2062 family)